MIKLSKVLQVERLENAQTTYDISVSGPPNYFANGALVHNCRYVIVEHLIGKPLYEVKVERLRPKVQLTRTQFVDSRKQAQWHSLVNKMECDPKRLKLIAEQALKDVKDGHMVLIPLARVKAIRVLTETINKLAGKKIAAAFYGGVKSADRDRFVTEARNYKLKILVGQSKLLSTGINIPRASALYDTTFSSNIPNCIQRVSRILTPYDGKPPPLLRIFLDDSQVRRACLRMEWYQCMLPKFRAIVSDKDKRIMTDYLSSKEREERIEW